MEGESHAFRGASLMNQFFMRYAQRAKTIELKVRKNFMNELNVAKQVVAIEIGKNGKSFTKNKELNTMIAQLYSVLLAGQARRPATASEDSRSLPRSLVVKRSARAQRSPRHRVDSASGTT